MLQWGWELVVGVTAIVAAIDIPVRLVLDYESLTRVTPLDWAFTIVFTADILVYRFKTRPRDTQSSPARLARPHRYPWYWFAIDLAAAVPFAAFAAPPLLQLFRLLKLGRVGQRIHRWHRGELENPNLVRLLLFLFWMTLSLHWIACGWLALRGIYHGYDKTTNYLRALYWCVQTLSTLGYGDITPGTDPELIYTIFTTLLGVGVFGYVIGSMASLLANIDPARVRHQEAVERVKAFMKYRQIPFGLQARVLDYYEYLWEKRLGYDELLAISTLPPSLKTEVSLFLNRDIIQKVPLFRTASEEFIRAIALEMQPVIFLPGDYIIRAGDSGEEMYFISKGEVEVVSADEKVVYATLAPGQFFGEMALILDQPRTASVRAVDYCDLYLLRKSSLERILLRYPAIAATITDIAKQRQEENIRRSQKKD
ncbi:MAG: hypothetical protein A3H27_02700 [Acidobacteria bacterium RIFCSPLOWO2_02_FULL_59_13]|nr:MAG: hypothetical protein A3H27_02700 [Acidobacteria bacterium RIFCSPLOWO2_02_FULL_59_13]